jgi:phospholipase D1/2
LEEKTIMEQRPPKEQADDAPIEEKLENEAEAGRDSTPAENGDADAPKPNGEVNGAVSSEGDDTPPQARTHDRDLFGAPADASTSAKTDNQPPHARSGVDDASEEENAAPGARSILRKHLAAKLGSKAWTLPTPRPKVDPNGFEDPICDEFWKNVWVASAAHNVCFSLLFSYTLFN